jgi:COMPASS component SWD2
MDSHHEQNVLFAGKGSPTQPVGQRNAVNYWSLYDNKILRKFRGHTDRVTCISMCPADDSFLTSSLDRTVRLWTAGQAGCVAELKLPEETEKSPLAAFDSTGLVFAVTAAMAGGMGHYLHLYDARNYSAGAFAELKVTQLDLETAIQSHVSVDPDRARELSQVDWMSMEFNVSGNQIMIGAEKGMCVLLDGFEGTVQRVLVGPKSTDRDAVSCYTPDDMTVLQGNDDGSISCWNVATGTITKTLTGHPGPVTCIAANPKYTQIASACTQTALWTW